MFKQKSKTKSAAAGAFKSAKIFTKEQLDQISEENYEVLPVNIYPAALSEKHTYIGLPVKTFEQEFEGAIEQFLRVGIISMQDDMFFAMQDMTKGQFELGEPLS